jgi:hypothetical protein
MPREPQTPSTVGGKMKLEARRWGFNAGIRMALLLAVIVSGLTAETPNQPRQRIGLPQDWTHRHVAFTREIWRSHPELAQLEPRVVHQLLERAPRLATGLETSSTPVSDSTDTLHRDWAVSLNAGRLAPGMSPAKYTFDTAAPPSCTSDYVVFALNTGGSATQANVIAFNQLYSGPGGLCGSGNPSVLFAYNVGSGRIATSPVISLDGTKIAFVETGAGQSIFHVLTWASGPGNGTAANAPAQPGIGNAASMVSINYTSSIDNRSSPWVDYKNDVAYIGANNGRVYKITGVFTGTPTLVNTPPWPVNIGGGNNISGPVLDQVTGRIFVGEGTGRLRSFDSVTGGNFNTLVVGAGGTAAGIVDAPIVDSGNGVVYAVSGNDGISAVVVQADTSTLQEITRARIGVGGTTGSNIPFYDGALDDNYFNNIATGTLTVCGTGPTNTAPWLYTFNFTGTTLNPVPVSQTQLLPAINARCSPITEFFNPNVNGGTDFFFFGLSINCFGNGTLGCINVRQSVGVPPPPLSQPGGTSAIAIDNESTAGQASSIYFTDLSAPSRAVKLTQSGLQ